ncbi:cupin domain-containing protein [Natronorubrum tibetense]|uniref:Cupin n=1 Tax=Natronorubrum tibetense GA33 TaxID=1114856 RepID=L9WA24_9EURY|nr:cupin domain-containing protein [Natronorubrum tibetense]ELY46222.1 cupin [Natronorubrum tibetense GA33]
MAGKQLTPRSDGEHLHVLGSTMTITADGDDTDGEFTVVDMLAPPGFENGLHTHAPSEVFHVLEGSMTLHIDGENHTLEPGTTGHVAGGRPHGFRVEGDEPVRVLMALTPAGTEDFFRAVGEPTEMRTLPEPREVTDADLEALFAVGEDHGFAFMGPLPADN